MAQPFATFDFDDAPSWLRVIEHAKDVTGLDFGTSISPEGMVLSTGEARVFLAREGMSVSLEYGAVWPPLQTYLEDVALFVLQDLGGRFAGAPIRRPARWK